ncbi:MAG: pyridoxal-dependent decarboxylase [Desulfobulbaceae bacterium]|nr:pyridoxal-dependent decarboxylase [Desulfobulbaceae bacterium]
MDADTILPNLLGRLEKYRQTQTQGTFVDYHHPEDLKELLALDDHEGTRDWQHIFEWVEKYLNYSVKTGHPGFVNRMWTEANLPSIVGEIVAAVANTSACTYEAAPVATLVEKYMIAQMLDMVGFESGEGQMTTGSSNGNMIAMLAARNSADAKIKSEGLFGRPALFAFVSADAHYSMDKAANIIGIGLDHLVKIPVNADGALDCAVLEKALADVMEHGGIPFFVGGTAGTTVRGAYDSIARLLALRSRYPFWLHIDGAWGGSVVLSQTLKKAYMPGIEQVDSFTWDFHKMLGVNLMANVLLINNRPNEFARVCGAGDNSYIFQQEQAEAVDLGSSSLQCGRRVDSLKWFLDWKFYGRRGYADRVERFLDLCAYAEKVVNNAPDLEMVVPRKSFNVCFRFKTPGHIDANVFNLALRTALHQEGLALVGKAYVNDILVLRLLITNPAFNESAVEQFFDTLVEKGKTLLQRHGS